jgi:thiamine-monophosphate kinase
VPTSEFELIQRCFVDQGLGFARTGVELGIGDDCALIAPLAGEMLAVSLDTLVAGVHFPLGSLSPFDSGAAAPALIANRALAVNLSDLAAMGAAPLAFTLGLTLPRDDAQWVSEFARGLLPLARQFDCPLIGGDTTRGPLAITIQVHGSVNALRAPRRSAARAGELICVTGTLGDAAAALQLIGAESHLGRRLAFSREPNNSDSDYLRSRYFAPSPRVAFARAAAPFMGACIDLSDGLLGDLGHILAASGVGARLDTLTLPFSPALSNTLDPEQCELAALSGGDDYELCFTAAPTDLSAVRDCAAALGLPLSVVGEIETQKGLRLSRGAEPIESPPSAYQHF